MSGWSFESGPVRSGDRVTERPQLVEFHVVEFDHGGLYAPGRRFTLQIAVRPLPQALGDLWVLVDDIHDFLGIGGPVKKLLHRLPRHAFPFSSDSPPPVHRDVLSHSR